MTTAVILDHYERPAPVLVADVLAKSAGMPVPVATKLGHRARWIVWENAPPTLAQAVQEGLAARGVPARVIPQHAVATATFPRRVHVLRLEPGRLGLQLRYSGEPEWVAWNQIRVISIGAFRKENVTSEEEYSNPRAPDIERRYKIDITRAIVADLFTDGSEGPIHIRLHSQEINYAQTIGATIHDSWRDKFSLLLARLGMQAAGALISPQTEALLAAGMVPSSSRISPFFEDDDDFLAYNQWLRTRQRLGLFL